MKIMPQYMLVNRKSYLLPWVTSYLNYLIHNLKTNRYLKICNQINRGKASKAFIYIQVFLEGYSNSSI